MTIFFCLLFASMIVAAHKKPERISKRFADRAKERKEENELALDQLAHDEARGKPCDPDRAKELCDFIGVSLEHFEGKVRDWEDRLAAVDDFAHLGPATAAIAKLDAEAAAENRRHELAMQAIASRREHPAAQLHAAERAGRILGRTQPRILTTEIRKVVKEKNNLQRFIDSSFGLKDKERDLIYRPSAYQGVSLVFNDNWAAQPGADPAAARAAIEAVKTRSQQFELEKSEAREKITLLENRIARLKSLALRLTVSESDIAAALADEPSGEPELQDVV